MASNFSLIFAIPETQICPVPRAITIWRFLCTCFLYIVQNNFCWFGSFWPFFNQQLQFLWWELCNMKGVLLFKKKNRFLQKISSSISCVFSFFVCTSFFFLGKMQSYIVNVYYYWKLIIIQFEMENAVFWGVYNLCHASILICYTHFPSLTEAVQILLLQLDPNSRGHCPPLKKKTIQLLLKW